MHTYLNALRKRLAHQESGFTLVELLIVLVIIGILLAIAVPSYLGFRDNATRAAVKANVRSAVPAAEAYYADNGTYLGMDTTALQTIDAGLKVTVVDATGTSYCITNSISGFSYQKAGPGATIVEGTCTVLVIA